MQDRRLVLGERVMQLSARIGSVVVALGGVVACVAACNGGSTTGFGSGTASFGGSVSGPDVSSAATPPPPGSFPGSTCPPNVPSSSDFCVDGACEYGGSADPACNVIARCNAASGTYEIEQPTHCPTTCPDHFDEHAPGASCSGTELCTYLEATCGCAGAIDGAWTSITGGMNNIGADGGDEASTPDGGDAGPAATGAWQCIRPGNGCPARRPVEGTRCSKAMDCDYGTCVFGVPLAMTCINERWTALFVGSCP
jgi:hypothetical protein